MRFDYTFCFSTIKKIKKDSKEFYILSVLDDDDTSYSFSLSSEEAKLFLDYERHQDITLPVLIYRNDFDVVKFGIDRKRFKELF